jgi:hypothetical protein
MEGVVLDTQLEVVVLVTRELIPRSSSSSPDWQCLSSTALVSSWSLGLTGDDLHLFRSQGGHERRREQRLKGVSGPFTR